MTKTEAKAIFAFRDAIFRACATLEKRLSPEELQYAEAYYLAHIKSAANGDGYGSAPISRANSRLEE